MANRAWFFQDARTKPVKPYSYLHLLCRDIDHCFGIDPDSQELVCGTDSETQEKVRPKHPRTGTDIWCRATWPGAMAIFAGIDFLGMFLLGSDTASTARRFKSFVDAYMPAAKSPREGPEVLFQLRNALLHSFGSLSKSHQDSKTYQVAMVPPQDELIMGTPHGPNVYTVDPERLHTAFDGAIRLYAADLDDPKHDRLLRNFEAMYPKYASWAGCSPP